MVAYGEGAAWILSNVTMFQRHTQEHKYKEFKTVLAVRCSNHMGMEVKHNHLKRTKLEVLIFMTELHNTCAN